MGTLRILLASFFFLATASTQQLDDRRFKVEGLVVDSITGTPLPQVAVELSMHRRVPVIKTVMTEANGEFSFNGIPAGTAEIRLAKAGYRVPGGMLIPARNMVDVGRHSGKAVLRLEPVAVISGRVIGDDGRPLEGFTVGVEAISVVDGRRTLLPDSNAPATEQDGKFEISGMAPGRYYLSVSAGAFPTTSEADTPKPSAVYPAVVYYPSATELAGAAQLDLVPGKKIEVEFTLSKVPAYTVAGRVIAPDKRAPVPMICNSLGQGILFNKDDNEQFITFWNPESGAFEFGPIPAGKYTVQFIAIEGESSAQQITVANNITDLNLFPKPLPDIGLVVRSEFAKLPPQRCWYELPTRGAEPPHCADPGVAVNLIPLNGGNVGWGCSGGSRTVYRALPGKYLVQAQATHGGHVQSVQSGSLDLLRDVLTVPDEGTVAPIEVVLRDDSASVKVTARPAMPAQQVHILALREGNMLPAFRPVTGYSGKEIALPPMAPGDYKVFAFDSLDGLEYNNAEVLARYASRAATITLSASENSNVTVKLIHNEK